MYTAPPSGDENDRDDRTDETTATAPEESADVSDETNDELATLDANTPPTDANWTGTVPADD